MRLLAAIVLWLFYFYPIVYYGIDRKITEKGAITSMHELGVVFHIIDDLKEVAVNNEISEITKSCIRTWRSIHRNRLIPYRLLEMGGKEGRFIKEF